MIPSREPPVRCKSLLPPQNATGNFIKKVVQRIPVKIKVKPNKNPNLVLRPGMNVEATDYTIATGKMRNVRIRSGNPPESWELEEEQFLTNSIVPSMLYGRRIAVLLTVGMVAAIEISNRLSINVFLPDMQDEAPAPMKSAG